MAELAVALLPFVVERLWNLLVRETKQFQGVEEQFEGLKNDVEMLRCFLKDAEAKKQTSEMVRKTIKDIKEIVFDAEDVVETYLLKKELGESSSSSVKRFAYVTVKRMGLGFDMETISKRISKVICDMQNLGVQKVLVDDGYMQALQVREREMRQTFSRDEEDYLVGLERNVEILVSYLLEGDQSQVVSITGMGGLGKTTLARQVFHHEKIKINFPGLAWVCVSQQFERKCVWQTILRQLRPECDVSKMMEEELQEKIVRGLETQKALIVIDDIWKKGDWDRIKQVFLPKRGWKVLLTSRNEEVALHADRQCVNFRPECLTFEESWDLFQRIAFPIKDTSEFKIDEDMKEIGKEMIKHCGGLPLALKVLGGLLHKKYLSHEWRRIYESISSNMARGFEDVFHVLYLSFEDLTFLCFSKILHDKTKLELGNLVKLETLKNFNTKHGRMTDLQGMTRLRSLSINITDERYTMETLSSSLREMRCLESLTIDNDEDHEFYTRMNDDEEGFAWDFVHLKQLELEIYVPRLPDAQHFPSQLTTISLKWCRLKEDPTPILEKLPHLIEIDLSIQSFCGRRMVCSRDGFPQLQKLTFSGLMQWEEWIVEEGSMPLLHSLNIFDCPNLKKLPDGLRLITSLKSLILFEMANEQKKRLSKGGEDYYKIQHIPSVKLF